MFRTIVFYSSVLFLASFYIIQVSSSLPIGLGISLTHAQYQPPPSPPPPPPNTDPGPFGQHAPVASCVGNAGQIRVSWSPSSNAQDYILYYKNSTDGITRGGWPLGFIHSYTFTNGAGVSPGTYVSFVLRARNSTSAATKYSNTSPYAPSVPNGWGDQIYGWTQFPNCTPPSTFTMTPTSYCSAVGTSRVNLGWTASSGATSYTAYYRLNGSSPEIAAGSTTGLGFNIESPTLTPGNSYQFLVGATSSSGTTYSNGAWSAPTPVRYCSNPTVNLTIDGGDVVKTIDSGSSVQLNYSMTNSYDCTTSANPSTAGVTTTWTNIYPSNTAVANPGSTTGSVSLTLYNDATYPLPGGNYQFTLSCTNTQIANSASNPVSKTVTVNVTQTLAPFIQTTQGDVHSNKDINVPAQGR